MGSKSREVRLRQRERVEKALEARLEVLREKGLEKKKIDRDPTVRELRAEIKSSRKRIAAIDAAEALARDLATHKAEKAAQPKQPKTKAKKVEEAPAKPTKEKKKKKKEEGAGGAP